MIGEKLSQRYELTAELGRGGMGVVYRARDPMLNREVAVKLIPPSLLTPHAEQRFQTEAQLVAQMDHPGIVSIYDMGRHEGSLFFVMPVVEGTSLASLLRDQSLVLKDVLDIGIQVAEALDYSHTRGVVHRDIKPDNIMVLRDEGEGLRICVMDFGLARAANVTRLTKTGTLVGTMTYMSPEQVTGKEADGRTDIYSLGIVLYECVVGRVPFSGEMQSVLYRIGHEIPQAPRDAGAEIDESLEAVILSCLEKDPEKRLASAGRLAASLREYKAGLRLSEQVKPVNVTQIAQAPRPALAPFVGREREIKDLQQRLNAAVDGAAQFVMISGEPGIGKTRLLDEIDKLAAARQIRVLHGRFVEQGGVFPYHGFCEAIQEYFRQKETGGSSSEQPDLSDLAPDLVSLFPMLSEIEPIRVAAGGVTPSGAPGASPVAEDKTQIFELLARTLIRIGAGKPMVLMFEDLHGAEISIDALQYVVRRLGSTPALIIGTYRSTEIDKSHPLVNLVDGFQGDRHFAALPLAPMTPSEHREFLKTLSGGAEVGDALAGRLFEGTEGNPFFTKELVRSLLDAGSIAQDDTGTWSLSGGAQISSDALPATIQQAIEKRIGRLPDDLRSILSIAAALGKTFDFQDLEALAKDQGDIDDAVDRFVQEGLLEEDRQSRGDRLTFPSGVVRDVLYGELSRRKRRSLHRKIASRLEKRHEGRLERVLPQLVYHFSEGDVPDKAVEYGLRHAKRSLDAFSYDEAQRSAKTALDFLDEEWEGDRAVEGEARLALANAHHLAGDVGAALKEAGAAIEVFEREGRTDRQVSALLFAAKTAWQARQTDATEKLVARGLDVARAAEEVDSLREFLSLAATVANLRGEYDVARRYVEQSNSLPSETEEPVSTEEIPRGGRLVVALSGPVKASEPIEIEFMEEEEALSNVFETLVTASADGSLVPALCESWEAAEGGAAYRFKLRPDVTFHDGQPLTADSVKACFLRGMRAAPSEMPQGLQVIDGSVAYAGGDTEEVAGIVVKGGDSLEIRLEEPLSFYPALLMDSQLAISGTPTEGGTAGTGPFRMALKEHDRLVLERNESYWREAKPPLDAIEFRPGLSGSEIAARFRSGELDVARDLLPQDLDDLLRDPRFRDGLVERPQKNTYFVLFNAMSGPAASNPQLREALAGVVRTRDLVWQNLGRFGQPAAGFLPPGILGHDPGRRAESLSIEKAREKLSAAGLPDAIRLKAAVLPIFHDRFQSILSALFSVWEELGVEVTVVTRDTESYLASLRENAEIDMVITRWTADYEDPDGITSVLFHSKSGHLRSFFSSPDADEILESARAESRPVMRTELYHKFEELLLCRGTVIPLFHAIDYRIASSKVRGLKLDGVMPYVNYATLGKAEADAPTATAPTPGLGVVRVPVTRRIASLDPALMSTVEQGEIFPNVYETLMRDVGDARIEPWLAADCRVEEGGKAYRFRLREDVLFHDGRRFSARDVRFTIERLLREKDSDARFLYSSIRGAKAVIAGEADHVDGIKIHSSSDLTIELERQVPFFPVLLANPAVGIVPEGTGRIGGSVEDGAVGTAPFRVARFDAEEQLELERNPNYWRKGYPKCEHLVFRFSLTPDEILSEFREGRLSLASDLYPKDVEALRRDPQFAAGFSETPRLSTYFAVFNTADGPLVDRELRRKIIRAVDVPSIVRRTLGALAIPAHGYIPPGLLGHDSRAASGARSARPSGETTSSGVSKPSGEIELSAAIHPVFVNEYASFSREISKAFRDVGVMIRPTTEGLTGFLEAIATGDIDIVVGRWVADYPDSDTFVQQLHSREGGYGRLFKNPEMDSLIEQARIETVAASRHSAYRRVEEIIAREALLLPLFHEQVYRFARPEIEGLTVNYWSPTVRYEELCERG